jgi:hypothetical protein
MLVSPMDALRPKAAIRRLNTRYIGRIQWGRMRWDRGAADSSRRTPFVNAEPQHTYLDERLRIIPQDLWDRVQARRASVHVA